jgi:hypothetical protein
MVHGREMTRIEIPVIDLPSPVLAMIRYNGKDYGISSPRVGLKNVGYPDKKTAMMYARNWRKSSGYLSLVVCSTEGKTTRYFVYVRRK